MEQTLVIIKPDGVQRGLVGQITSRFEHKGLKLVGMKMISLDDKLLENHYAHHVGKPFFAGLIKFMKSAPVVLQVWEGVEVVGAVRKITGVTKARDAEAGSIRGDFAMSQGLNVIHCSDSLENAKAEIKRFFTPEELLIYNKTDWLHVYAEDEK